MEKDPRFKKPRFGEHGPCCEAYMHTHCVNGTDAAGLDATASKEMFRHKLYGYVFRNLHR